MADRQTSTGTNDNTLSTYYQRRLVRTLDEQVWLYQLCRKFPFPKGEGKTMVFNSARRIEAPSSTLAEMSANSAVVISSRSVSVTINQYGRNAKISSLLEDTAVSSPTQMAIERLLQSAALAQDNVVQRAIFQNIASRVGKDGKQSAYGDVKTKMLSAWTGALASSFSANTGTSGNATQWGLPIVFATSATRLSAGSTKTASSIFGPYGLRKAAARLMRFDAPPFGDGNYVGVVAPHAMASYLGNPLAIQWHINYESGPSASMFKGKVTTPVHGIRLIVSTNIPRYASSAISCVICPVLSPEAVGVTELGDLEMIVKRPGDQTTSDPYNLFSTAAYKFKAVAAVLNPSAGCVLIANEASGSNG